MKKKLLIVVNVDWFFLSHRLPVGLAALLQGYEVHLATEVTSGRESLSELGFHVHHIPFGRNSLNPLGVAKTVWRLGCLVKNIRPDVVHLVTIKPVLIGGLIVRISSVSGAVYAISGLGHVFTAGGFFSKVRRFLVCSWYRIVLGGCNITVIFQNPEDLHTIRSLKNLSEDQMIIIPGSGVDLVEYSYVSQRVEDFAEVRVMMASRLLAEKGVREFVAAARRIRSRNTKARLWLVGAPDIGNPSSITQEELRLWENEGSVEVLGARKDVAALMQRCHIVVLPSYYGEGLPKVLIEASACGRAIITTDMPGCRDAIEPGVTGLLVRPQDSESLADAIQCLIDDPQRCIDMGAAGRQRAEQLFNVNDVAKKHIEIYDRLLNAKLSSL